MALEVNKCVYTLVDIKEDQFVLMNEQNKIMNVPESLAPAYFDLSDLSLNTIVKIENGANQNPTIETLIKVAKALEVEVDDLIK